MENPSTPTSSNADTQNETQEETETVSATVTKTVKRKTKSSSATSAMTSLDVTATTGLDTIQVKKESGSSQWLNSGWIAAIVIVCVLAVLSVTWFIYRKRKRRTSSPKVSQLEATKFDPLVSIVSGTSSADTSSLTSSNVSTRRDTLSKNPPRTQSWHSKRQSRPKSSGGVFCGRKSLGLDSNIPQEFLDALQSPFPIPPPVDPVSRPCSAASLSHKNPFSTASTHSFTCDIPTIRRANTHFDYRSDSHPRVSAFNQRDAVFPLKSSPKKRPSLPSFLPEFDLDHDTPPRLPPIQEATFAFDSDDSDDSLERFRNRPRIRSIESGSSGDYQASMSIFDSYVDGENDMTQLHQEENDPFKTCSSPIVEKDDLTSDGSHLSMPLEIVYTPPILPKKSVRRKPAESIVSSHTVGSSHLSEYPEYIVVENFAAECKDDLSLSKSEIIVVTDIENRTGFGVNRATGQRGRFPIDRILPRRLEK